MAEGPLIGAVEAGGTKVVCAVGTGPDDLRHITRIPTTTPDETLGRIAAFFAERRAAGDAVAAVGVASFGPVELDRRSPNWGFVTATPKPGWSDTDLAGPIGQAAGAPVAFDTDVNGAALGEVSWGAGHGLDPVVYVTVGTGFGGGAIVNGRPVHGLVHPEMGHILVRRDPARDPFPGRCPFHGDCLEGLACGPALIDRWGEGIQDLPPDHDAWALEAHYLGQFCATVLLILSPQRIILGGGVMGQRQLYPLVRRETVALLADYIRSPAVDAGLEQVIVPPGLGDRSGILGAVALGQRLLGA